MGDTSSNVLGMSLDVLGIHALALNPQCTFNGQQRTKSHVSVHKVLNTNHKRTILKEPAIYITTRPCYDAVEKDSTHKNLQTLDM